MLDIDFLSLHGAQILTDIDVSTTIRFREATPEWFIKIYGR